MQKQEGFYYQAQAGAPTDTDTVAIGRSPQVLGYTGYIGYIRVKGGFQAGGRLIGHLLSKGCVLIFDWFLLPRQTTNS